MPDHCGLRQSAWDAQDRCLSHQTHLHRNRNQRASAGAVIAAMIEDGLIVESYDELASSEAKQGT